MIHPPKQIPFTVPGQPEILDEEHAGTRNKKKSVDYDVELAGPSSKRKPHQTSFRGWKECAGWRETDTLKASDELQDLLLNRSILARILPTSAYGDWYHGVGVIGAAGFLSWLIGRLKWSIAPIFVIMLAASAFYRTSVRAYRVKMREEAQREFSIKQIETDDETLEWLNTFLDKYWPYLEPSMAQIVTDQVNPILAESPAPKFIKQLWMDSFSLGTKPPRVDRVKTLPGTHGNVVVMDWGISFSPNLVTDATHKQLKNRQNQNVVVKANLFGFSLPIVVKDVSFNVDARVRIRMMPTFPHIKTINVSLLSPPQYDFCAKPFLLGDSIFSWEIVNFPGFYTLMHEMTKKFIGPLLYAPLSFQLNIEQLMTGSALNSAIGVLAVKITDCKDILKPEDNSQEDNSQENPFFKLGFKNQFLARTAPNNWSDTLYICVSSVSEPFCVTLLNAEESQRSRAVARYDLETLLEEGSQNAVMVPALRNNKPLANLKMDLEYMPVLHGIRQADGSSEPPPDLNTGIVRIDVGSTRSTAKPTNKSRIFVNRQLVSENGSCELIVTDRANTRVKIEVLAKSEVVGAFYSPLSDLLDAAAVGKSWQLLSNGGEVNLTTTWDGVELTGVSGSAGYRDPIGVLRVEVRKASGLKNLERIGTIDPYVRLLVNGAQRSRTLVQESTLDPEFDESLYIPINSPLQKLTLEAMDVEKGPDRSLGAVDVKLDDLFTKDAKNNYVESVNNPFMERRLITKKGPRGTVTFSLQFYPTVRFREQKPSHENDEQKKKKKKKEIEESRDQSEKDGTPKKQAESRDTLFEVPSSQSVDQRSAPPCEQDDEEESQALPRMSFDQLQEFSQGVLVYTIVDGHFPREGHIQTFFDSRGFPDFSSPRLSGRTSKVSLTGDFVVRELSKSQAIFRFSKNADQDRTEGAIAEAKISTQSLLQQSFSQPFTVHMEGSQQVSIRVQCKWIPLRMKQLPVMDSIENVGKLNLALNSASGLAKADTFGKSDPYLRVVLNGKEVYKTDKIKRTLSPTWNEKCAIDIANRVDATLRLECYDWDMGPEPDDQLGHAEMKLSELTPGEEKDITLTFKDENDQDAGEIKFSALFNAEYVVLIKPQTRSALDIGGKVFGAGGKILGEGIGAGGKVIGGGVGVGGKILGKGGSFLKKGSKKGE